MDSRIRYEVLPTDSPTHERSGEELHQPLEPVELHAVAPEAVTIQQEQDDTSLPPAYDGLQAAGGGTSHHTLLLENNDSRDASNTPVAPPSYNIATTLPSYEEAERSKLEEAERGAVDEQSEVPAQVAGDMDRFSAMELGTDAMFLCMFMVAFLFNWIGLLASLCMTHTVAGRLGAISGFGLSMVKWVAIVKHNNWTGGVAEGDSLVWWLLILLGFLIFFRGCTQYIRIKYQWNRVGALQRNRLYLVF